MDSRPGCALDKIKGIFQKFDTKGSGCIPRDELKHVIKAVYPEITDVELETALQMANATRDDAQVSYGAFLDFCFQDDVVEDANVQALGSSGAQGPEASKGLTYSGPPPTTEHAELMPAVPMPMPMIKRQSVSPLEAECPLTELLAYRNIALIHNKKEGRSRTGARITKSAWLQEYYVIKGHKLIRRQQLELITSIDLPVILPSTVAPATVAQGNVAVISHGWLCPGHPDPCGQRREDIKCLDRFYVFWDFLSLLQLPRSCEEEANFRTALASMHVVYGHSKWTVYRMITVPDSPLTTNTTPYLARGWCFFESCVAAVGAAGLITIRNGTKDFREKSPVPLPPPLFEEHIQNLHFTSKRTDTRIVCQLYARIFPTLAKRDFLMVYAWGAEEVTQLETVLPDLTGLKTVYVDNAETGCISENFPSVAPEVTRGLSRSLSDRGGMLKFLGEPNLAA